MLLLYERKELLQLVKDTVQDHNKIKKSAESTILNNLSVINEVEEVSVTEHTGQEHTRKPRRSLKSRRQTFVQAPTASVPGIIPFG